MRIELSPESIEAVARRVVELLREEHAAPAPELVDAAEIARRYGLSRGTVYERAVELGAIRLGDGPRARLRFDPVNVAEVLKSCSTERQPREREAPANPGVPRLRPRPGARAGARAGARSELLPIRRSA